MTGKSIHVVPAGNKWAVEGGQAVSEFRTQAEAIKAGRELARSEKAEFVIHGRKGEIRSKDSYGHDPRRVHG